MDENEVVHSDSVHSDGHGSAILDDDEQEDQQISIQYEESSVQSGTSNSYFYRSGWIKYISHLNILIIFVKSTVGTGLFVMPYAFACVGLFSGIVLLIGMGFLITKCLRLLIRIHRVTCTRLEKVTIMYDEIVEATLKNADVRVPWIFIELATFFTNALLIFYHLGVSSVCVDFIGDVVREIMKLEETNHPAAYTMLFFPLFMLLNLTKDLHDMIPKSVAGNILILNVIMVSLVCAFKIDTSDTWTVLRNDIFLYPRFIGIVFYSLSSPGLVLAIEHSTSNSNNYTKFHKALDQGMILITCLHLLVGIVGYLKWGSNVSENFIRDMQKEAEGYALIAFIMQALAIYLTYGLQCYVPISIFLKQYGMPAMEYGTCKGTLYLWDLIARFAVTLVSCILPMLIPKLRLRVALLGVTCNFILTLLLPLVLHMLLFINDLGETAIRNRKVIAGILSIVLACVLASCCFITELSLIFKKI